MKGIIFSEFLEMVERDYGYEAVDRIISENELSSKGAYTAIGTYDHGEMVKLITSLSKYSGNSVSSLLKIFGYYFFDVLKKGYPQFLKAAGNAFDFLESIENYIHVEVRKLYPDAELPTFETRALPEGTLEMIYRSERKMADFAEALIEKSIEYYHEEAKLKRTDIEEDASVVKFLIFKN